jgi:hypothetical protein
LQMSMATNRIAGYDCGGFCLGFGAAAFCLSHFAL